MQYFQVVVSFISPRSEISSTSTGIFRINAENFGQFERTLIIADEGSEVMYMEGCTAPKFETSTLHSAVVELVALKGAKIQYVTVQNWSTMFSISSRKGLLRKRKPKYAGSTAILVPG